MFIISFNLPFRRICLRISLFDNSLFNNHLGNDTENKEGGEEGVARLINRKALPVDNQLITPLKFVNVIISINNAAFLFLLPLLDETMAVSKEKFFQIVDLLA